MTTKIFYFTGTGNTLNLAKDVAKLLGKTELIKITYEMEFKQTDCDIVGIAYPVYCFGLPNIVTNFINKVKLNKDAYIFGLASYGGLLTNSGNVLKKKLKANGYELNAGFAINMPGNATMVYNVPAKEKQDKMFAKKAEYLIKVAEHIKNKETAKIDTNLGMLGKMMSLMCDKMMSKISESDKSFFVDAKCDGCGVCAKVCPVGNITMEAKNQFGITNVNVV